MAAMGLGSCAIATEAAVEPIDVAPCVGEHTSGIEDEHVVSPPRPAGAARGESGLRDGWPVDLGAPGAGFPYTPTLHDIDGDGADEIFMTGGHTFGLSGDGSFLPGWPTSEMAHMGYGTNGNKPGPSVANLDNDGDSEILWTERDWWAGSSRMWCFNGKNADGSDLPGFPQQALDTPSNALDTPFVLADTDADGNLEAWGAHTLGNTFVHYRVSGFDHLGSRLFTTDLDPAENIVSLYFGDVDGNGSKEMFGVSWLDPSYWLHVFDSDGNEAVGYPVRLHTFSSGYLALSPPVPVDFDGDGDLEFLFGQWGGGTSQAYCSHHDGSSFAGFPFQIATSSQLFYVGLGDITGDGEPELIATDNHLGGNYRALAIDIASATQLPGWPFALSDWPKGFPTIADIDNDGIQDVCLATDGGELYAVSGDGQVISGYPKQMISPSISGVAAGDIDGDGLFELVASTWDGWVYAWDTTGEALPGRADWPMRGIDARNTGVFGDVAPTTAVDTGVIPPGLDLRVEPNPVTFAAGFSLDTTRGPVTLRIYDGAGRAVATLNSSAASRIVWTPQATNAPGVYYARCTQDGVSKTARFVLLR